MNEEVDKRFTERDVDLAYMLGIFNTAGIEGLVRELERLKNLNVKPHKIIEDCKNNQGLLTNK